MGGPKAPHLTGDLTTFQTLPVSGTSEGACSSKKAASEVWGSGFRALGWLKIAVSFEWETDHINWCVGFFCSYIVASCSNVSLEQHEEWKVSKATLIGQWSFLKWVLINPCEGGAIYFDPGDYIFLHDGWMDTSLLESVEGLGPEATSASKCWETLRSWECLSCRFKDFLQKNEGISLKYMI